MSSASSRLACFSLPDHCSNFDTLAICARTRTHIRPHRDLPQIEDKVRAVTARKDEQIAALRETLRIKELRAQQIEALLERQRHELGGM